MRAVVESRILEALKDAQEGATALTLRAAAKCAARTSRRSCADLRTEGVIDVYPATTSNKARWFLVEYRFQVMRAFEVAAEQQRDKRLTRKRKAREEWRRGVGIRPRKLLTDAERAEREARKVKKPKPDPAAPVEPQTWPLPPNSVWQLAQMA